jgi:hypothetical protein
VNVTVKYVPSALKHYITEEDIVMQYCNARVDDTEFALWWLREGVLYVVVSLRNFYHRGRDKMPNKDSVKLRGKISC